MEDIEALKREADAAHHASEQASRQYDRRAWVRLAIVFFPVPFLVALLRLHLQPWGYYALGGSLAITAGLMLYLDRKDVDRRERAALTADRAKRSYEDAQQRLKLGSTVAVLGESIKTADRAPLRLRGDSG